MSYLYLIDYRVGNTYKNKIVNAKSFEQALKKARLKNIEEIRNINLTNFNKKDFNSLVDRFVNERKERLLLKASRK